jgi:plastocyanin
MQPRNLQILLTWLSLLIAAPAWAANIAVTVGGTTNDGGYYGGSSPMLAFTPSNLTINVGDTITFTNAGGAPHNVHADDDSFMCSNGCRGDGSGASGAPSAAAWSAKVTFSKAGTFGFHCDEHVSMGMTGNVTVKAVTPSIAIGGYMSGNWYNANQGGSGFQIEAATNNNMIAIWFVYSPDGTQQNWIYAQGTYSTTSNTATLPAELLTGAKFPPNFNPADVHQLNNANWGTITFTFSDCNTGTASWHSDFAGYNDQNDTPMAITRLTQIDGTTCPQ